MKPPIAGPSTGLLGTEGPDLKHLVEEAVKKVLLGGGLDPSKVLGQVETSSIISQIKKEKQESDDEVCIIEEEQRADGKTRSPSKPKLYLPPANCPVYKPTPIKELQSPPAEKHSVLGDIADLSESDQEYLETSDVLGEHIAHESIQVRSYRKF